MEKWLIIRRNILTRKKNQLFNIKSVQMRKPLEIFWKNLVIYLIRISELGN